VNSAEPDKTDALLDAALATYSAGEPRLGFEQRVVHRIRSDSRRRALVRSLCLAPAPLAVTVWIVAGLFRPVELRFAVPPAPAAAALQSAAAARMVPRTVERPRPARRPVFPSPSPLTEEERALAALVAARPDLIPAMGAETAPLLVEPLQITPLEGGLEPK
jgi:hypothetical protein